MRRVPGESGAIDDCDLQIPVPTMSSIDELLRHPAVWRARSADASAQPPGLPTSFSALDRCLPGGGWPRQGLIELLADRPGIGELRLLMPALAALCSEEREGGWLAWVLPPYQPYAPALAACGIDIGRVLVVRRGPAAWVMEQSLRSGSCSAVLAWVDTIDLAGLRRLQLAAEQSRCLAILFRGLHVRHDPSPAVLRIALEAGHTGLALRIEKSRGGRPKQLQLRLSGDPAHLSAH
jgi:hypothetical protein